MKKFTAHIVIMALIVGITMGGLIFTTEEKAYAASIDSAFPTSYKTLLTELAKEHPNWSFKAINTGLNWDTVVAEEAKNNRILTSVNYADILLSKASSDFNATTGKYIPKDGSTWVVASKPAIAYYMDPRNFLIPEYIFQFEALSYDEKFHTVEGVESILDGTDLSKKKIEYTSTTGEKISTEETYGSIIHSAGKTHGINPLFLASRIKQETGAKLTNGSISGKFSYNNVNYTGYYNYYNIGAYATSTGSAVANGLAYAKKEGWDTPMKAIEAGAKYLTSNYIARGQNTGYFQKFNVVYKPYYNHQYMQNMTAAVTEASATYNAYKEVGIEEKGHVFYIPVYNNMPETTSTVKISKTVKTGQMIGTTNMRQGPSTGYGKVTSIPQGGKVTIDGAVYMDKTATVSNRMTYPYWCKVTYGDKIGYVILNNLKADVNTTLDAGKTLQLKVTKASAENVYYETSNPAVATVSSSGVVTAVGAGECHIYAISSSGQNMDMIGLKVTKTLAAPKLTKIENTTTGIKVTWDKVSGATYYRVYRKEPGGKYTYIKRSTTATSYTDTTAVSGKTYIYTVRAGNATELGPNFVLEGITGTYLAAPKLVSAIASKDTVVFTWNKVPEATGYIVYRKADGGKWEKLAQSNSNIYEKYTDKSMKKGTKYYYTVRAYTSKATSWYYSGATCTYDGFVAPKLKSIANDEKGIKISWESVEQATYYRVYRMEPGGKYAYICKETKETSYIDETAELGKTYTYTVRAGNSTLLGAAYDGVGLTGMRIMKPALVELATEDVTATLTWAKVEEAKGYYVYRKNAKGGWSRIATITDKETVKYIDKGLTESTEYVYTVRAYNGKYTSDYEKAGIKATTLPKRTDINAISLSSTGVKLAWPKVNNADGYIVYRMVEGAGFEEIAKVTAATTNSYLDNKVESGNTYVYSVRTYKGDSYAYYDLVGKKVTYLSRPTPKIEAVNASAIKVAWTKVEGAKGYYVYRKNSKGTWVLIATIDGADKLSYVDKGLAAKTNYVYTVRAYYGSLRSAYVAAGVTGTTTPVYLKFKTTTSVKYRNGAGTSYATKGTLSKGTVISVEKGFSKVANGYTWYRFVLGGKNYYVAAKYLQKVQ